MHDSMLVVSFRAMLRGVMAKVSLFAKRPVTSIGSCRFDIFMTLLYVALAIMLVDRFLFNRSYLHFWRYAPLECGLTSEISQAVDLISNREFASSYSIVDVIENAPVRIRLDISCVVYAFTK